MAIPRGYEFTPASTRHPTVRRPRQPGTVAALTFAAGVAASVATRSWMVVVVTGAVSAIVVRRTVPALLLVLIAAAGLVRSDAAWHDLEPDHLGPFTGWATVVTDPQPFGGAARVILEIDGERYEAWVRGRVRRLRVESWQAGDVVAVAGERRALDADRRSRVAWQHVVGDVRGRLARRRTPRRTHLDGVQPSAQRDRAGPGEPPCRNGLPSPAD